jgi:L-amino acid N-acyltransferase YncA
MSLLIREATEDDLPAVLALYAQPAMDNGKVLTLDEAPITACGWLVRLHLI